MNRLSIDPKRSDVDRPITESGVRQGPPIARRDARAPDAQRGFGVQPGSKRPRGECSLWWRNVAAHPDHRLGYIGHFRASDAHAAMEVLRWACQELARNGCTLAVGPIDGSTWCSYRLVTEWGNEPAFFMEPQHPRVWPQHFQAHGFVPWLHYFSAVDSTLNRHDPLADRLAADMQRVGVRIRPLQIDRFAEELSIMHALALSCFGQHDLYREIDLESFLRLYQPLQRYIDSELVLIAERASQPVGFVFAVPDSLEADRGQPISTVIVKSLCVLPDRVLTGLGYHLLAALRSQAVSRGFQRCIYAMMREGGYLQRRITRFATPIRRYAVFARELVS